MKSNHVIVCAVVFTVTAVVFLSVPSFLCSFLPSFDPSFFLFSFLSWLLSFLPSFLLTFLSLLPSFLFSPSSSSSYTFFILFYASLFPFFSTFSYLFNPFSFYPITPITSHHFFQTTVYRIILMNGGSEEYARVKATYYATEDNIERKYAMNR